MSEFKIRTNHKPRPVLDWWQLTDKERKEFEYIDSEDKQADAQFVRYRGWVYDLHDMERGLGYGSFASMPEPLKGWDNYLTDSYFSGIAIKWVYETDEVICATFTC